MSLHNIDVNYDFTTDSPHFWDFFWENNNVLGSGGSDPDSASKTLQRYHQLLWSKPLPNGQMMELSIGTGANYLTWQNFRFGSDSITASFRYNRCREILEQVATVVPDYRSFIESFLRQAYTIGGTIIFPKRQGGINQSRGRHPLICDRWDLTLECIRKHYNGEQSPLSDTLAQDKAFFDLFVDFKGYIDFFFLQDCVSSDYRSVKFRLGSGDFSCNPLPQTVSDYLLWIEHELQFVTARNRKIQAAIQSTPHSR